MKVNPTKFQRKNAHENIASFKIDSVEIKCEDNVNLFGVNIDFMLSFDDHVTDICKTSFKTTGSFKTSWKILIYKGLNDYLSGHSFIISNFIYCPLDLHFYSTSSTNNMKKVQERALRFINNDVKISCLPQILSLCM